jgi:urease gamma subunit
MKKEAEMQLMLFQSRLAVEEHERCLELFLSESHSLLSIEMIRGLYADLVVRVLTDFGLETVASADNMPGPCYDEIMRRWPDVLMKKEVEMQSMLYSRASSS